MAVFVSQVWEKFVQFIDENGPPLGRFESTDEIVELASFSLWFWQPVLNTPDLGNLRVI